LLINRSAEASFGAAFTSNEFYRIRLEIGTLLAVCCQRLIGRRGWEGGHATREIVGKPEAKIRHVEFVCGPYDGLHVMSLKLADAVALPVNPNLLRRVSGDPSGEPSPVSALAFYRLHSEGNRNRYEYVASVSAKRFHMDQWIV
jgi:hypothetical protein